MRSSCNRGVLITGLVIVMLTGIVAFLIINMCSGNSQAEIVEGVALVDQNNRNLIGSEVSGVQPTKENTHVITLDKWGDGEVDGWDDFISSGVISNVSPEAPLAPASMDIIILKEQNLLPEVILTNGACVIFAPEEGTWHCDTNHRLYIEYELYESEVSTPQTVVIGHIQDGTVCSGQTFSSIMGVYQVPVLESANCCLYMINASSDYLTLKTGVIKLDEFQGLNNGR